MKVLDVRLLPRQVFVVDLIFVLVFVPVRILVFVLVLVLVLFLGYAQIYLGIP